MIARRTLSATPAAGGAGTATVSVTSDEKINGEIFAVYLAYLDSPPAGTTDVTLITATAPAITLLSITNASTDGWFYPMAQAQINTGANITNQGRALVIDDQVTLTIAQANVGDGVTATILYEDGVR